MRKSQLSIMGLQPIFIALKWSFKKNNKNNTWTYISVIRTWFSLNHVPLDIIWGGLWPLLKPTSRGQSKCMGFPCGELSCSSSLHTVSSFGKISLWSFYLKFHTLHTCFPVCSISASSSCSVLYLNLFRLPILFFNQGKAHSIILNGMWYISC